MIKLPPIGPYGWHAMPDGKPVFIPPSYRITDDGRVEVTGWRIEVPK